MSNPKLAKKDKEARAQAKAEGKRVAEVKAGNRAREAVRRVPMDILVKAIEAFGDEFRKNPTRIGEGVMAYAAAMRNNPRLAKFDRAQINNLLGSKTNVQAAADTYFKNHPQDRAKAFALAVDYRKKQGELVELRRLMDKKAKKDKDARKQRKKRRRQEQETKAVVKAAAQPNTKAAKKVAKSVGKKARELDKSKNKRARVTIAANKEAGRLRKKVARLRSRLAAQAAKPATQANVVETKKLARVTQKAVETEQKMTGTMVIGAALTKNTAAQAAIAKHIEVAIQRGNTAAAAALTRIYLRLGGVAERLKGLQKAQLQD